MRCGGGPSFKLSLARSAEGRWRPASMGGGARLEVGEARPIAALAPCRIAPRTPLGETPLRARPPPAYTFLACVSPFSSSLLAGGRSAPPLPGGAPVDRTDADAVLSCPVLSSTQTDPGCAPSTAPLSGPLASVLVLAAPSPSPSSRPQLRVPCLALCLCLPLPSLPTFLCRRPARVASPSRLLP